MTSMQSAPPAGRLVFEARGLTKVYRMGEVEVHALRGVDLDLFEGEFVVLLGASGSGKSTLLNILGGLDVPTSGTVRYRDHLLTSADEAELTRYRREHVGFVFQFYNLVPSLTARENVALVTDIAANPLDPAEALRIVGLEARMDHFPSQLSGGEQQRIVVLEAIERVNRELGTTTAVITHNAVIAAMADRVITLSEGRVGSVVVNSKRSPAKELVW